MSADDARARFAAATDAHLTAPFDGGITIRHVDHAEVMAATDALWNADGRPGGRIDVLFDDAQKARGGDLAAVLGDGLAHRLVLETGGEIVGAYWGQQEPFKYYMVNTILRADVRGRGLYRALLERVVAAATAAGFPEVYSRHRADNNAILVPKLKAGFVIAAFEVSPKWGLLVHLRRYLVEGVAKLHANRVDGVYAAELRAAGALPGV